MTGSSPSIVLGICGSIAAYKTPYLVRLLDAHGYAVHVVMTPSATQFVSPLVLNNLSRNPVVIEMFDTNTQRDGSWHIHMARGADAMLIAPASANSIAALAHGLSNSALSAVALALPASVPLLIAPAMDTEMWDNPVTQRNLDILRSRGAQIIDPENGPLASGARGMGRLADLNGIVSAMERILSGGSSFGDVTPQGGTNNEPPEQRTQAAVEEAVLKSSRPLHDVPSNIAFQVELELEMLKQQSPLSWWKGRRLLLTAGPTRERIDDVRYVSNYSSGTMGYALAQQAAAAGAMVELVSGPTALPTPPGVQRHDVESASEMFAQVQRGMPACDVLICSAAVADYRPTPHTGKLKKSDLGETWTVTMKQTDDILAWAGHHREHTQFVVGFALESTDLEVNAASKLKSKSCQMIIANSAQAGMAMGSADNQISIFQYHGDELRVQHLQRMSKAECARAILLAIAQTQSSAPSS